ncbi:MAG: hypothetical protein NVS4B11_36910 [Ktedonobacteraceae bacterium]
MCAVISFVRGNMSMKQTGRNPINAQFIQRERRRQESAAKTVPYISFILTHAALVLFIGALFIVDRLVNSPAANLTIKIIIVIIAVILLASEWIYAIISSLRWKRDIQTLQLIEEEHHHFEEEVKVKTQETAIMAERQKALMMMFDIQKRRRQERVPLVPR